MFNGLNNFNILHNWCPRYGDIPMARFNPKTIGPDHKPTSSGEVEDCNGENLLMTEDDDVATSPHPPPEPVREAWSPISATRRASFDAMVANIKAERTLSEVDI